jgi:hypothetical protein
MDGVHASVVSPRGENPYRFADVMLTIHSQAIEYARSKFNLLQPGEDLSQEECLAQADALRELIWPLHSSYW